MLGIFQSLFEGNMDFIFQLVDQLAPGGRIIIPVGPEGGEQYLEQIDKSPDGKISRERFMGVRHRQEASMWTIKWQFYFQKLHDIRSLHVKCMKHVNLPFNKNQNFDS